MKYQQSGFTLIELIMVIVILGILAATAIPKFVDLSTEAQEAATDGVAGAAGAAMAINSAVCSAGNADCVTVADCDDVPGLLEGDALPAGYTVGSLATPGTCVITHTDSGDTANFQGISAS